MPYSLPRKSGISLKPQHYQTILETKPEAGWFEVHPENYMGSGGSPHRYLTEIRAQYPLSMHGVGMSLGSATGIDDKHLKSLCVLVDRYQPEQVSEHLSWSRIGDTYLNDLLPLPYNDESLTLMVSNIDKVQSALKRSILVENPSSYIGFNGNSYTEPEFLNELVDRSGCRLLLDINNIFVSACNQEFDPCEYITQISTDAIGEIHLAGHAVEQADGSEIRIDDHGSRVIEEVWNLYATTIKSIGRPMPVMIEWDTNIPELDVLLAEMNKAEDIMKNMITSPDENEAA